MAIYRVDQYARTFYGPNPDPRPGFKESTFTAHSLGYDKVFVTWDPPLGEYTGFRLVKSTYGYPIDAEDGQILVDTATSPGSYTDTDVIPGQFVYYAIFLLLDGVWVRAGTASTLHIKNFKGFDFLYRLIPHFYRRLYGNYLTIDADTNRDMIRLIRALGYGVDRMRTSLNASLLASDMYTTHITQLAHIAASIGAWVPEGVRPSQARALTIDSAYLSANRGMLQAMRSAARAASGWDVQLRESHNLMPSPDMAEFIHPTYPEWDASIHYRVGQIVTTDDWLYICVQPAYGIDQAPPGNGSSNTWWEVYTAVEDRTVAWDAELLTQHGWSGVSHTGAVPSTQVTPKIAIGLPHPTVDSIRNINALTIHNDGTQAADISAWSLPANPTGDPLIPIQYGIPLPLIRPYDRTRVYHAGDIVSWRGMLWRATRTVTGRAPISGSTYWMPISTDERLPITVSAYVHQPHSDSTKQPVPVHLYVTWFDDKGHVIGTSDTRNSADLARVVDTFNAYTGDPLAPLEGRSTDTGGKVWVSPVPGFHRDSHRGGVVRLADGAERAISVIDYGQADATVAATLVSGADGKEQCLILRYSDNLNYLRATRSALQRVEGGLVTTLVTYAKPVTDGDRLTVRVVGTNYQVMINGQLVATASDGFNSSATRFGIGVEA